MYSVYCIDENVVFFSFKRACCLNPVDLSLSENTAVQVEGTKYLVKK